MNQAEFQDEVEKVFGFLVQDMGFSTPKVIDFGREIYIEYSNKNRTVSVSLEAGSEPLLELYLPCEGTSESPVPFISKAGVNRYRKVVKISKEKFFVQAPTMTRTLLNV